MDTEIDLKREVIDICEKDSSVSQLCQKFFFLEHDRNAMIIIR